ncbi:hypothetical protein RchiOBHm_Chr6g0259581 [Rosa chinensis]|uniref:DUF7798 domain-containing protein n=1 Tax=Rosa chinensis TaxID=74649 RepID=A0A2P6PMZ4_ROSCH|nr:hypothetical protein RchiOBHm_Chr6g0259581 [Rosa chinensis]
MEEEKQQLKDEKAPLQQQEAKAEEKAVAEAEAAAAKSGGGWGGGWGFSSVFTDLQKAAEEISRNAAAAAQTAAKSIADMQTPAEDSEESSKEEEGDTEKESQDEHEKQRKAALEKLEKASEDSFLSQHLKVLDSSVENFASGAWQALGSAFRGGTDLVHKLEHSAVNLAESIQRDGAGSVAPSLLETGKAFTSKGMQALELVGKETLDLLITETGIEVDKNSKHSDQEGEEDQLYEEVGFDRCFYIYGGPEHLEELEALSSHYALLFNRRKGKLSPEQRSVYDGKLKLVQQIFSLNSELDGSGAESDKGKRKRLEPMEIVMR